jgi:hypothetical protein
MLDFRADELVLGEAEGFRADLVADADDASILS